MSSTSPSTPNSPVSFPVAQHSTLVVQSVTTDNNNPAVPSSLALSPQHHPMTSIGSTLRPPSPLHPGSSSHSGPSPSQLSLNSVATRSVSSVGSYVVQREDVVKAWIDVEGEITFLKKDDDSWNPIRFGMLASKDSDSKGSWRDGNGVLLDTHFLWFEKEKETSPSKKSKPSPRPSHVIRPIPLEYLQLASFNDDPEERKHHLSLIKRVGSGFRSSSPKETVYPFTILHAAAKITRRYTLYTKSKRERNKWKVALERSIEARKSQQDPRMLYNPQVIDDGFFKIAPRIQFNREAHYTGRVSCSASFSVQGEPGEDYIAIGCTTGVYISKNIVDHSFHWQKVLESNEPTSIVAIPEYNKFIVHCDSALYSYSLELAIRVSQGDDASQLSLDDSEERLGQDDGAVLFFKAGRVGDRTLIVYASKSSKQVTSRVFELTHPVQSTQTPADSTSYKPLGSVLIPEDPHDATFILDKVAVYTSKAVYLMEPTSQSVTDPKAKAKANPCYNVLPELPNPEHGANAFQRLLTRTKASLRLGKKSDTPKILELVGKASILGAVTRQNDILVVYNDLGCFVNEAGKPVNEAGKPVNEANEPTDNKSYYIEWERKATAFARSGSHLLLFSPGYVEVRDIDTGKLVWLKELREMQLLRSGWTESPKLAAAITSKENDGGFSQKLVELVCSGN